MAESAPVPTVDELLQHLDFVRELSRSLLSDAHQAEDVAQEAMLAALRQRDNIVGSGSGGLRGWLFGTVRNLVKSHARGEGHRKGRESAMVLEKHGTVVSREAATPESEWVEGALVRAESKNLLVQSVMALPEHYRTVIVLRYMEELPPREIARVLALPLATVNSRLQRGLSGLRDTLDKDFEGGRGAWFKALMPLAFPKMVPPVPGSELALQGGEAASVGGAGGGAAVVGTVWKLAGLVASVALVSYVGLTYLSDEQPRAVPSTEVAELEMPNPTPSSSASPATSRPSERRLVSQRTLSSSASEPINQEAAERVLRIVDTAGDPLVGAQLFVAAGPERGLVEFESDTEGLVHLPSDRWMGAAVMMEGKVSRTVSLSAQAVPVGERSDESAATEAGNVAVDRPATLDVVLEDGATVTLQVLARETGRPIKKAQARFEFSDKDYEGDLSFCWGDFFEDSVWGEYDIPEQPTFDADSEGRFEFGCSANGRLQLSIEAPGYVSNSFWVYPNRDEKVHLASGVCLDLRRERQLDQPLRVWLLGIDSYYEHRLYMQAGQARLRTCELSPGEYYLWTSVHGEEGPLEHAPAPYMWPEEGPESSRFWRLDISEEKDQTLNLDEFAGRALEIAVRGAEGLETLTVCLETDNIFTHCVSAAGPNIDSLSLPDVPPGDYSLLAYSGEGKYAHRRLHVGAGEEPINLVLELGSSTLQLVATAVSESYEQALHLQSAGSLASTRRIASLPATVEGLQPGAYELWFEGSLKVGRALIEVVPGDNLHSFSPAQMDYQRIWFPFPAGLLEPEVPQISLRDASGMILSNFAYGDSEAHMSSMFARGGVELQLSKGSYEIWWDWSGVGSVNHRTLDVNADLQLDSLAGSECFGVELVSQGELLKPSSYSIWPASESQSSMAMEWVSTIEAEAAGPIPVCLSPGSYRMLTYEGARALFEVRVGQTDLVVEIE